MSKSFFEKKARNLKVSTDVAETTKKPPVARPKDERELMSNKSQNAPTSREMRIFDDTDTCRMLGLRKRIVVAARTERNRNRDWAVVGEHAGMSEEWILKKNPSAKIETAKQIAAADGITTVRIIGRCTNDQVMIARKVSNGERVMVKVRDSSMHFIGDQMDCRHIGGILQFMQNLNPENY